MHPPPAALDRLRLDRVGAETALRHVDGLVQRDAGRLDTRLVPLAPIDQLLALAGQRRTRRLIDGAVPLVDRLVNLSRLRVLRPALRQVLGLLELVKKD